MRRTSAPSGTPRPTRHCLVLLTILITTTSACSATTTPAPPQVGSEARIEATTSSAKPVVIPTEPAPEPIAAKTDPALLEGLPRPRIDLILPAHLPMVGPAHVTGLVATPLAELTAGYADPTDASPVLALEQSTDLGSVQVPARWAVVDEQGGVADGVGDDGWVQVLVPLGRGARPSEDPSQVNHHAVWLRARDVVVSAEPIRLVVDLERHELIVFDGPDVRSVLHVGTGAEETPTLRGLCAIVGRITTNTGAQGLLTSCQSETLDGYDGATFAAFAIHQGEGFDPQQGGSVSHGCIRVPPQEFVELEDVPTGATVVVQ